MNKVIDYIISLTNLYGLVHKDKVVEIYNMQNEEKINAEIINLFFQKHLKELSRNFVEVYGDYFVSESIIEFDEFDEQLSQRRGKPFYVPEQEELLRYRENTYFEVTNEYKALFDYVTKNFFDGDKKAAEMLCEDVQSVCQYAFSVSSVFEEFTRRCIQFKNEKQASEVMQLIMDLNNNTRIWENNGHTPREIFELMEKPNLRPLPEGGFPDFPGDRSKLRSIPGGKSKKVGRNAPCPCGSGKKYKKCCLGKDVLN